jgi:RNA polymerase primary sigma factor
MSEMGNTAEMLDEFSHGSPGQAHASTASEPQGDRNDDEETNEGWRDVSADPTDRFFADVARVGLLSRQEEEELAFGIASRRERIRKLLQGRRRLVSEALSDLGRGLVHPDEDFREREAIAVLGHARKRLGTMRSGERGRKTLGEFVLRLSRELGVYRGLRDEMMTANIRLVMALARRYRHPTLSYLDLVQEGVLGLMRAVEKYEPSRGIKFGTYAVWWVWQQISRAADCQGAMIRTPVHWNQLRRKLGRAIPGENGDSDALAELHGVSPDRLATMSQQFQCLSLAAPLGEEDDRTLGDMLTADSADDPEGAMMEADLGEQLAEAVEELPEREAQILRLRFGLSAPRTYTLEEIGQLFGVSRERIRQLEARALKRMREICAARGLAELLN